MTPGLSDVPPNLLDDALRVVLAPPGAARANRGAVQAFREYLRVSHVAWQALYDPPAGLASCAFLIRLPGRSAVALLPNGDASRYSRALAGLAGRLRTGEFGFAQSLVEPEAGEKRRALESVGFRRLTGLVYLERDPTYPWVDPPEGSLGWIGYSPDTHERFRSTIARSYVDSLDCPELTALRTTDDAIASHRAAGLSATAHWHLLSMDGSDAGVLLLSAIAGSRAIEISYMGLVPEVRRRGLGAVLLRRALDCARTSGARAITIVVDERNAHAHRLYERFEFRAVATRDAYLLVCKNDAHRTSESCG